MMGFVFVGCGKKEISSGTETKKDDEQENKQLLNQQDFLSREIEMPDLKDEETMIGFGQNNEEEIECFTLLYGKEEQEVFCYILKDEKWSKKKIFELKVEKDKFWIITGAQDNQNGDLYLQIYDQEMKIHLVKVLSKTEYKELELPEQKIQQINAIRGNIAYLISDNKLLLYNMSTMKIIKDQILISYSNANGNSLIGGMNMTYFYGFIEQGDKMVRINNDSGEKKVFKNEFITKNGFNLIALNSFSDTSEYYLVNRLGIYFFKDINSKGQLLVKSKELNFDYDKEYPEVCWIGDNKCINLIVKSFDEKNEREGRKFIQFILEEEEK